MTPYSYRTDPGVPAFPDDAPIVVFDGVCALCSATTQFILTHDRERRLRFVVAQSSLGQALYRHFGLKSEDFETIILLENGAPLTKSDSAIRILELVGQPWSLLRFCRIAPRSLRDTLYDVVARHRYRWFGVRQNCFLPSAADRARFIA